jgi:hypothetical protein
MSKALSDILGRQDNISLTDGSEFVSMSTKYFVMRGKLHQMYGKD